MSDSLVAVHGVVELDQALGLRTADASNTHTPKIWLSVYEASTLRCDGEYITETSPGSRLMQVELASAGAFDLQVLRSTLADELPAELELEVLVDRDGNGACDEGDAMGTGAVGSTLHASEGCSARL